MLPLIGHPRDSKRIDMLQEEGFDVQVCSFIRPYHNGRIPRVKIHYLGEIAHGQYLKRVLVMCKSLFTVRKQLKKADLIYCSGLDMAILALIGQIGLSKKIIIEIGDIREIQCSNALSAKVFRLLDRFVCNRASLIVVTAADFWNEYYLKILGVKTKGLVLENKLEPHELRVKEPSIPSSKIRIGYFGLLRCQWSLEVLLYLVDRYSEKFEIVLAGIPFGNSEIKNYFDKLCESSSVKYLGEYKSPNDLPKLYSEIDIVWGCYPEIQENDWNLKWARPNRFYESCFFGKPIISRFGSNDGVFISKNHTGLLIDEIDIVKTAKLLDKINLSAIDVWKENVKTLDRSIYMYTSEYEALRNEINMLSDSSFEIN